ncbi:hypothetical protein [Cardinium endosymbiont of Dermatophagoides farinae]|uniref:hypothetical protein n=1 Tax=Cardinium endosymbiont of Dermatophagoides farinae TaxID=2597823 RepID=UPI001183A182|nr:hypothetical protein [Cardinium endosymbiont of Dermatophagoides farinae]TSJ81056.1 hypothetical protein FPG78_03455 [Cardinium endosymbiont of Dermatophagoides farinae]
MRKTIQKITGIIALSASLVNYTPAFASEEAPADDKACDWHIGVKAHSKSAIKTVTERFSMGLDFAIGPFVEWKPLDQIGIQTGLMYVYNDLLTGG